MKHPKQHLLLPHGVPNFGVSPLLKHIRGSTRKKSSYFIIPLLRGAHLSRDIVKAFKIILQGGDMKLSVNFKPA